MNTCTCGGMDIGVGVMHEPYCMLYYMHCVRCAGRGWALGGDGSREQGACPVCNGTGVRPSAPDVCECPSGWAGGREDA